MSKSLITLTAALVGMSVAADVAAAPTLASATSPCRVDLRRYSGGYADLLWCGGERMRGVTVQATDGRITGVSWRQYEGKDLMRSVTLDHTGQVFFLVHDDSVRGGFYAKSRAVWRHVFPRRYVIRIDRSADGLVVHDPAGNAWALQAAPRGDHDTSWAVTSINGARQQLTRMNHTERGIVGADLTRLGPLVLYRKERSGRGMQDRRSAAYQRTRSVFVDANGGRCEVVNRDLFGPNPNDPDDKYDNQFRFADDAPLRALLVRACPKLDLSALGAPRPVRAR